MPATWQRSFWIGNVGILVMIFGSALEVRIGLPMALFGFIEIVGTIVSLVGIVNAIRCIMRGH